MTELIYGVTIRADGTGLVGVARQSKDALAGVGSAAKEVGADLGGLGTTADRLAATFSGTTSATFASVTAFGQARVGSAELAAQIAALGAKHGALVNELHDARAATAALGAQNNALTADLLESQKAVAALSSRIDILETRLKRVPRVNDDVTDSVRRSQFAVRNAGQQFGDFGLQVASGADPARAFGQQIGQLGFALSEFEKGPLSKVGKFLVGPWGIALTVGAAILAPFIEKLFTAGDAADKETDALHTLSDATDALDKATGRLTRTKDEEITRSVAATKALLNEAIAKRTLLAAQLAEARQKDASAAGVGGKLGGELRGASGVVTSVAEAAFSQNEAAITKAQVSLRGADAVAAIRAVADASDKATAARHRYEEQEGRVTRAIRSGQITREQGEPMLLRAAAMRDAAIKSSRAAGAATSDLSDSQARLAAATTATSRAEAQLSLLRKTTAAEVRAGTLTEAERTAQLTKAQQAVTAARAADASAAAGRRALAKDTEAAAASQRIFDNLLVQITQRFAPASTAAEKYRATMRDIADLYASGDLNLGQYVQFTSEAMAENRTATTKREGDAWKGTFERGNPGERFEDFANVDQLVAAMEKSGRDAGRNFREEASGVQFRRELTDAVDLAGERLGRVFGTRVGGAFSSIVNRNSPDRVAEAGHVSDALKKISQGVGISAEGAATIGKYGGKAIEGAATGALANSVFAPLAKGLGLKTSQTGAQIGGALGSLTGIPGGDIIGSILGSVVGGLFKTSKTGGATISSGGTVTTSGNSSALEQAAAGLAKNVTSGLAAIAQQLGGTVGSISPITIGTYGKNSEYRVNTAGGSQLGGSSSKLSNVEYFGSGDEGAAAALAYALRLEVERGAVEGLDDAVRKALLSSSDLDTSVKEALKVQQVEQLIGGIGASLKRTFTTFDSTAAQSLAVAKKYGLDVIAVEKTTATARTKLIADTLKASVGSLQDVLTSLDMGDLFQGSGADKRSALLAAIGTTKASADAGEDGAADKLASLYQQLLSTTRDVFGTAGTEFGSDLAEVRSGANEVIKAQQARIDDASKLQQAAIDAMKTNNDLTDETNDLLSVNNARLSSLPADIAEQLGIVLSGGSGISAAVSITSRGATALV